MSSRHNVFFYIIALFLVLTASASYYRFIVLGDFMVSYEVDCDPFTEDCFIGCEDNQCTEEYFYSTITRHANEIEALCGNDITDCEAAQHCSANNNRCTRITCDSGLDACDVFSENDDPGNVTGVNNDTL
jgi:hypothetical protein